MQTFLDCVPCLLRQSLEAARYNSDDVAVHEKILKEVSGWLSEMDMSIPAPVMAEKIHRRLRELTGNVDPYRQVKDEQNELALAILDDLEEEINSTDDPVSIAVRLAIAGNIIDLGVKGQLTKNDVHASIQKALAHELMGDIQVFKDEVAKADKILYLADNAGEIVFDRLLIERLPRDKITLAVRGEPIINDVTMEDAVKVGLTDFVPVVSNGAGIPGTMLSSCTEEFQQLFAEADLIISKGQGNFETLYGVDANIIFLFQVKCELVTTLANAPLGSHMLLQQKG